VPAVAMLAGGGALFILKASKRFKILFPVLCLFLAFSIFTGFTFSYPEYHMKTYPNGWPGAKVSRDLANYLNKHMKEDDKLLITEFAYWKMPTCPVFIYYWKPKQMEIIKGKPKADEVINRIKKNRVSWLVIANAPDPDHNFNKLMKEITQRLKKKGKQAGWSFVWNTQELWANK
jgi:hypothetical protein